VALPKKKELLLQKGAELIHLKGFNHTGINEILEAAYVPRGSFYFYFKNKEDFGLQLIDYYSVHFLSKSKEYLGRTDLSYLTRLREFFDDFLRFFDSHGCALGCPIGNLAQEMGDLSEIFRKKLGQGAVELGDISPSWNLDNLSDFILNSWEGALVRMKVTKDTSPLILFDKILFDTILVTGSITEKTENGAI
jgi:TetR/AcrR family transcriptional repressor of nem operon